MKTNSVVFERIGDLLNQVIEISSAPAMSALIELSSASIPSLMLRVVLLFLFLHCISESSRVSKVPITVCAAFTNQPPLSKRPIFANGTSFNRHVLSLRVWMNEFTIIPSQVASKQKEHFKGYYQGQAGAHSKYCIASNMRYELVSG